jgi:ribonuclease HI
MRKVWDIYTDGSCHPNPNGFGGWAAVIVRRDGEVGDLQAGHKGDRSEGDRVEVLSGHRSNASTNEMELWAVRQGVEYVLTRRRCGDDMEGVEIRVWTDSSYAKGALAEWWRGWMANGWRTSSLMPVANESLIRETLTMIKGLHACGLPFRLKKIKGHAGHYYNEVADNNAGQQRILLRDKSKA